MEMWAVWDDEPGKEHPFPHQQLDYFRVDVEDMGVVEGSGGLEFIALEGGRPLPPDAQPVVPTSGVKIDPYEPITWPGYIDAKHDDGFRLKDLFRELKEAPEYGLRLNQFFQDRSFQRQQERNFDQLLGKWIILARKTPGWNEGEFLELGKAIIQSLRDAYWRACKVDVEAVHRKMDKDDRAHNKFFQHVTDQLSEREKYRNRYGATFFAGRAGTFALFF